MTQKHSSSESGFAIAWILLAVILMAAIMAGITYSSEDSSRSELVTRSAAELKSSAQTIKARLASCAIEEPSENNGCTNGCVFTAWPEEQASIADLACPGRTEKLFSGKDGVYLPSQISGFEQWQYRNDATGIELYINALAPVNGWKLSALKQAAQSMPGLELLETGTPPNTTVTGVTIQIAKP